MDAFVRNYAVFAVLGGLGLLLAAASWAMLLKGRSGLLPIGALLIILGGLSTPHKWLAAAALADPCWLMAVFGIIESRRYRRVSMRFVEFWKSHDFELSKYFDGGLSITVKESGTVLKWSFSTSQLYTLREPRLYFMVCKQNGRYIFAYDRDEGGGIMLADIVDGLVTVTATGRGKKEYTVELRLPPAVRNSKQRRDTL